MWFSPTRRIAVAAVLVNAVGLPNMVAAASATRTSQPQRNRARASRRQHAALDRLPPAPNAPDLARELGQRLDDVTRLAAVRGALASLHQRDRDVLALCVWGGLDCAAAASVLNVPVGTVRSRLSRARRRLQQAATAAGPPLERWPPPPEPGLPANSGP